LVIFVTFVIFAESGYPVELKRGASSAAKRKHLEVLMRSMLTAMCVAGLSTAAMADVKLPAVISDHMVIQRDKPVAIWGWANAGEKVTVSLGGMNTGTTANADGKWSVRLEAPKAAGPFELSVKGNNALTVKDVLVGEVWLCSGQSNMGMTVNRANNFEAEQKAANHPTLRMFIVAGNPQKEPQADVHGQWYVCTPDEVGKFSATAYFFGVNLLKQLHMPIGLINSSVGGTPVEAWTSMPAMQTQSADLKPMFEFWDGQMKNWDEAKAKAAHEQAMAKWKQAAAKAKAEGKPAPQAPRAPQDPFRKSPAVLYNGMINGLIPYTIKGAIWYQGENNAGTGFPELYLLQLTTMINDWRQRWADDFYFGIVQLPNFRSVQKDPSQPTGWVLVQEADLKASHMPKVGTTFNTDIGEETDIHPKNKQEIGRRLALWALHDVYGQSGPSSGPRPQSFQKKNGQMILTFNHVESGLKTRDGGPLKGFAISGSDNKFVWADAKITGPDTIVVSSPSVASPEAVRYNFAENPIGNLVNGADLPATPFRTDTFKIELPGAAKPAPAPAKKQPAKK
jgi:sialate O-acetylesterase